MGRTLKFKSFKQYIVEDDKNILTSDVIKSLNAEFYDISPKDEGQKSSDIKELFKQIQVVLDGYNITMVGDNYKEFNGQVITNKGQSNVLIASKDSSSEGGLKAFENVILDVKWNTFDDNEYALKSVSVKER